MVPPAVFKFILNVLPKLPVSVAIKLQEPGLFALSNVLRFNVDVALTLPCPIIVSAGFVPFMWNKEYAVAVPIPTLFEKVVRPEIFNVDKHDVAPFNLVIPLTFNELRLV